MTTNVSTIRPASRVTATEISYVPVAQMVVSPMAQRELKPYRVSALVADFDLDRMGLVTLSLRDGKHFIVDGQHRVQAATAVLGEDVELACRVHVGLTEEAEAELFLRLNDVLAVTSFDKFAVAVVAGRDVETDINRIVRSAGLVVSRQKTEGAIGATGVLRRIYTRDGADVLATALGIVRDAYGDPGLEASIIDGIGLLCARYGSQLDIERVVTRLRKANGGAGGLLNRANVIRRQTGVRLGMAVAAAAVDIVNAGKGGRKLTSWWTEAA